MAKTPYKLSAVLYGHSSDVRAVTNFEDGTIVSTSRDKTARVWKPTGDGKNYSVGAVLQGHTKFVSSVCVLNTCEGYPQGVIITGSNDCSICIYSADGTLIHTIKEAHKDTVCCLRTSKNNKAFLSSSWDTTAKLWELDNLCMPKINMQGHNAAVWCVCDLISGNIITGSADKNVIIWSQMGTIKYNLTGHKDCVRDIVEIKDEQFLTCSNDATIRHWNSKTGACLGVYNGHDENYIYSVAANFDTSYIFTSGEDWTIRVWHNQELDQTILLPSQSVWSIAIKSNGDIISGASDGIIRIFSADPERYADPESLKSYEEQTEAVKIRKKIEHEGIKVDNLPLPSALEQPGKKDGETKMINHGGTVKAHSWSQSEMRWICIGDVLGASSSTNATTGKQLYNGKEYDYVFSVDIEEGAPPLKLPYNHGDDPWHVAQKFINDNGLSQMFLDQVANFIVKNASSAQIPNTHSQYADPFTGGSRYIPASASVDDLEREKPVGSNSSRCSYIPHLKYLRLEQASLQSILVKLREFNLKEDQNIEEEKLQRLINLAENEGEEVTSQIIEILEKLLNWPDNKLYPVLDMVRLLILRKEVNDLLCTDDLVKICQKNIKPDALPSNQMLSFRLIANMICHENGERLALNSKDETLKALLEFNSLGAKSNQIALSTYLLNLVIALNKHNDVPGKTRALNVLIVLLPLFKESEALFRILVALGTLIAGTSDKCDRNELINVVRQTDAVITVIKNMSESSIQVSNKLIDCSKQIIDLII
ncbi:phospholipase A-2-activating protein [Prorops nasuta]|uniref:phospholipase A-2-activating protein n=1 Tax=Prorops nasuta TaxID=863751 RepID=UPI0034D00E9E